MNLISKVTFHGDNTIFIILGDFHDFDRYMHSTKA